MQRSPLDRLALIILIIGGLNWLSIGLGLFQFGAVAAIFGDTTSFLTRTIYTIVGLSGLYCITLLFRETNEPVKE